MEIGEDAVLRIIPDASLAEDGLLAGLEILEHRADSGEAEFAQVRMTSEWRTSGAGPLSWSTTPRRTACRPL